MRRRSLLALVFLGGTPAVAELPAPVKLAGPEIIATFQGKTLNGTYASGMAVRETYATDGSISYWDPRGEATGTWSVVNDLFCTFYDGMAGACFRVEKISSNCFDFMATASTPEEALRPEGEPRYTARAHVEGQPDTCPNELAV